MIKANHLGAELVNTNSLFCSVSPYDKYLYLSTEKIHMQKDNHLAWLTQDLAPAKDLKLA